MMDGEAIVMSVAKKGDIHYGPNQCVSLTVEVPVGQLITDLDADQTWLKEDRTWGAEKNKAEALYIEVKKHGGPISLVTVIQNARQGSITINPNDTYEFVRYQPQGAKSEVRFLSRDQVVAILKQALEAADKKK